MRHNIKPNEEEQPAGAEEPDCKSLSSEEIAKLQAQQEKKPSPPKRKHTPTHKRKEKPPQEGRESAAPKVRRGPFGIITDALQEI